MRFSGRVRGTSVFLTLVLFSSCSSGGPEVTLPTAPALTRSIDTEMRPTDDGFAFANFAATAVPDVFDESDLVAMFGPESCVDGVVEPCEPVAEAAAWARMINDSRASGHCEGLVVEALTRFNEGATPPTVELQNEGQVTKDIFRSFATQFLESTQQETLAWQKKSVGEIVNQLGASLASGRLEYSLGLYVDSGGHAVLPYAVELLGESEARIHVYDSNWPAKNRFVDVDLANESWEFSFSGEDPASDPNLWAGGSGDIDLTSLSSRQSALCPFCQTETTVRNSIVVIKSTDRRWSISTERGTYSPSSGVEVEGVSAQPVRSAGNPSTLDYVVFVEGLDLSLDLPDPSSAYVARGSAVVQVQTRTGSSAPVEVTEDSVVVDDESVQLTVAANNLVASVAAPSSQVAIGSSTLDVTVQSGTGREYELQVNEERPALVATAIPREVGGKPLDLEVQVKVDDKLVEVRRVFLDGTEQSVVEQKALQLNEVQAPVIAELKVDEVKPGLSPSTERSLLNPNYQPDQPVTIDSAAVALRNSALTTTTLAPTTTVSPTTTLTTTTTTRPPTPSTTSSTTTSTSSTTTTTSTTTTIATTPAPTTSTSSTTTTTTVPPYLNTPTGLSVAGSDGQLAVSWTAPSPSGTAVESYTVAISTDEAFTSPLTFSTTSTAYTWTSATNGVMYYVKVRANNTSDGVSSTYTALYSVAAGVAGMTSPTSVRLTPQNGQVEVTWNAPSSPGASSISDYRVYYSTVANGTYTAVTVGSATTSKTVTGLTNGTTYYFRVAGVNTSGTGVPSSTTSGVTPFVLASAPTGVALSTSSSGSLTFAWGPTTHTGDNYRVWWSTDSTFATAYTYTGTTSTSYTITGLSSGAVIYFRVAGWRNGVASDVNQFQTSEWGVASGGTTVP